MAEELTSRVINTIAATQRIDPSGITPESTFQELGIDSMDAINIVFALENEFNINIPDDDVRGIRSVADVIAGIGRLTS
jgi:acyl carrier protein